MESHLQEMAFFFCLPPQHCKIHLQIATHQLQRYDSCGLEPTGFGINEVFI